VPHLPRIGDTPLDQMLCAEMTARAVGDSRSMHEGKSPFLVEFAHCIHAGMQTEIVTSRPAIEAEPRRATVGQQSHLGGAASDVVPIVDGRDDAQCIHSAAQEKGHQDRPR